MKMFLIQTDFEQPIYVVANTAKEAINKFKAKINSNQDMIGNVKSKLSKLNCINAIKYHFNVSYCTGNIMESTNLWEVSMTSGIELRAGDDLESVVCGNTESVNLYTENCMIIVD